MPAKKEKSESSVKTKEAVFVCKFCEKKLPISEMSVITRFFPAAVACKVCAKKMR
jgi:hypothetical protein